MSALKWIAIGIAAAGLVMAQSSGAKKSKTAPPSQKAAAAPAAPLTPPQDAEKLDENTYRSKDSSGKVWIFQKTPFGWTRSQEGATVARTAVLEDPANSLRVSSVQGETIQFEKPTPFGVSRWSRKKSELTQEESEALSRFENPGASARAVPVKK